MDPKEKQTPNAMPPVPNILCHTAITEKGWLAYGKLHGIM